MKANSLHSDISSCLLPVSPEQLTYKSRMHTDVRVRRSKLSIIGGLRVIMEWADDERGSWVNNTDESCNTFKLGVFGPHISQFTSYNYHETHNFHADFSYCLGFERALWDLHTSRALNRLSRKLNELVHAQVLERRHSSTPRPSP